MTRVLGEMVELSKVEAMEIEASDDQYDIGALKKYTVYAMPGEGIFLKKHAQMRKNTYEKLVKVRFLLKIMSCISAINLIGLSGSCTMGNAAKNDDVDIFIITDPQRIWTVRFIVLVVAFLLGKKRSRSSTKAPDKACFNMFFDARDIEVPFNKRSVYTAHEVLQMKPIGFIKKLWNSSNDHSKALSSSYLLREKRMYKQFIQANSWVVDYFPNGDDLHGNHFNGGYAGMGIRKNVVNKAQIGNLLGNFIEVILKKIQLFIIHRHQTKEIITESQLWFFPRDFEVKLKSFIPKVVRQSR
jgi:hypothetical protein